MAAPRKRTARKTTTSRSRAPVKSGRSSASVLAMGMIAGLAVAILFYAIFIRQDANLSKGSGSQYAHTPNQPHLLNPLPPRPRDDSASAGEVAQSQPTSPRTIESVQQTPPPVSIAESTARDSTKPATQAQAPAPTTTAPKASEPSVTKTPAPTPSPSTAAKAPTPAPKQPQPRITEDAIGNLIAQNERAAKSPAPASTPKTTPTPAPKDNADHVGALIKTMPSGSSTDTATSTTTKSATINPAPTPEKTIALNPIPTEQRPFYLQTGPYKAETEADAMRAQLLLLGHSNASVHKALVNNQTIYRVRIGPYTSDKSLKDTQKTLEAAKLKLSPVH
ncbi:MAG: SPOR domain-containing protein [Alcaligenaceae bacterium]|nr:SPOR domain-containing protein [Alcaligenaceae bacterium]